MGRGRAVHLAARRSPATETAYGACIRTFGTWASKNRKSTFPAAPETFARFLAELADNGYAVATIRRYVSAIGAAHVADGLDDPTKAALISAVFEGIARERGTASVGKAALSLVELARIIDALPETRLGIRDRAIILLGFAAALRRSELAALEIEDLRFTEDGVELLIRASKTDQRRAGQRVFVPFGDRLCPVEALRCWLKISGFATGPLFRRITRGDRALIGTRYR